MYEILSLGDVGCPGEVILEYSSVSQTANWHNTTDDENLNYKSRFLRNIYSTNWSVEPVTRIFHISYDECKVV